MLVLAMLILHLTASCHTLWIVSNLNLPACYDYVSVYGTVTHVIEKSKYKAKKEINKRGLARCPINHLVLKGHLVFDGVNIVPGLWMCSRKCMSAVCAILTGSSDSLLLYTIGCKSKV